MSEKVGTVLTVEPAVWQLESEFNTLPIQRTWQWQRNGVAIPNAVGGSYTITDADSGANISVVETAGFILEDTSWGYKTIPAGKSATSTSATVLANTNSADAKLVYSNNLSYAGSFKLPDAGTGYLSIPGYAGWGTAIKANGASPSTLYIGGHIYDQGAAELAIPLSLTNPYVDYSSLVTASLVYPANPATALPRVPYTVDLATIGVDPVNGVKPYGMYANNSTGKLYFSAANFYTYSSLQLVFRRPISLADTNQANLEGPFFFDGFSPRWSSGWFCGVPSTPVTNRNGVSTNYRTALGGDMLASLCGLSVLSAASNGATATVFSDSDITTALTRVQIGTARGGTLNSIQLAVGASSVSVGDAIFCPDASDTGVYVTAFDNISKIANVQNSGTGANAFGTSPTASSTYRIIPRVSSKPVLGYGVNIDKNLEPYIYGEPGKNRIFQPIWNQTTRYRGMFIPDGTRSLLFICISEDGFSNYGPAFEPRNYSWLYTNGAAGTGPHQAPVQYKVTAFDLDDLVDVASGARNYNDVKPYASWSFSIPGINDPLSESSGFESCAYDSKTKTVYLTQLNMGPLGASIVHALQISNAVIV